MVLRKLYREGIYPGEYETIITGITGVASEEEKATSNIASLRVFEPGPRPGAVHYAATEYYASHACCSGGCKQT